MREWELIRKKKRKKRMTDVHNAKDDQAGLIHGISAKIRTIIGCRPVFMNRQEISSHPKSQGQSAAQISNRFLLSPPIEIKITDCTYISTLRPYYILPGTTVSH